MKKELVFLVLILAILWVGIQQLDHHVGPWLRPVVLSDELDAAKWTKANIPPNTLFLSGIFGGELLMGIAGHTALVGGDWAANPNSATQMSAMDEFYKTNSSNRAEEIWRKYNASYAWFPTRSVYAGYGWFHPNEEKMDDPRFEIIYENREVRIYKLRENVSLS